MDIVPSYILKAERAEKHLQDLKAVLSRWADTHPYEVSTTHYRKRDERRLHFTASPPREAALIAADFIYNLRSGLDHLMGALVPSSERRSVMFPIYFAGVWEDPIPGEDAERTKDRGRWKSDTAKVRPEAVAILKSLQPPAYTLKDGLVNAFRVINLLSNRDRHQGLPLSFSGLRGARMIWTNPDGSPGIGPTDTGIPSIDMTIRKDGAILQLPPGAMNVKVTGAPVIAIEISKEEGNIELPGVFATTLQAYRQFAVEKLVPYIHRGPSA